MLDHNNHNWQVTWLAKILRFLGAIYVRKDTVKLREILLTALFLRQRGRGGGVCGVEAVVAGVEVGPGVGAVEAAVDAGPRVLRQARVSVVLDPGVGLRRHVLHLLKKYFIKQGKNIS